MRTLGYAAAVVIVLLTCIFFAWLIRLGRSQKTLKFGQTNLKETMTPTGYVTYAILVCSWVVGIAAARLWPGSPCGSWIREMGLLTYLIACGLLMTALQVILHNLGYTSLRGTWGHDENSGRQP